MWVVRAFGPFAISESQSVCVCVFVCACASVFSNPKASGVRVDETNLLSIERMSSSVQWLLSGTTVALHAPLSPTLNPKP